MVLPQRSIEPVVAARELIREGKADQAFDQFEKILRGQPRSLAAHRGLVEAASEAGRLTEAEGRYRLLARMQSTAGLGAYGLGLIAVNRGPGHMKPAIEQLSKAAALLPKAADIPYRIGLIYLMNGELALAEGSFDRALSLDSNLSAVYVARSAALFKQGRAAAAVEAMRPILDLQPTASEISKAQVLATKVFDPMRGAVPDLVLDLKNIVDLLNRDTLHQALFKINKILLLHPQNPFAHTLKGLAHSRLLNQGEAVVAFERALELRPQSPMALLGLGDVYTRLEKWSEARKYFEQAIALNPFDAKVHQRMGEIARLRKDHDRAAHCFQALILLEPENLEYRRQLAMVLFAGGQIQASAAAFEAILALAPDDQESLIRLGSLYALLAAREPNAQQAHRRRARAYLERVLELNPDNATAAEMLVRLED